MKKVAKYIIILLSIVLCFSFSYQPITNANSLCDKDDIPTEVKQAAGCEDASSDNKNGIENAAAKILNGVIAVLSLVAVGFIIGVIQDSLETAINSSGDVMFAATAEYMEWQKQGRSFRLGEIVETDEES